MKWILREPNEQYKKSDGIFAKLIKVRGIDNVDSYFDPTDDHLIDPYLLRNIDVVAHRIIKAATSGERICVSADCDSDGIFSTAIMMRYLRQFTDNVYYIYAQRSEGHGIEYQMDKIEDGTNLLVILDSSTNSTKACKEISEKGIDIVILDHHAIEEPNPYAIIVNPQGDDYPNKEISGATLAYKTIMVMDDTLASESVDSFLDLVACGMYADIMSVNVMENRAIIFRGMQSITNQGVKSILKLNKVDVNQVNSLTIGFTISPMINGVARMDRIELALELLLEDDFVRSYEIAKEMKALNEQRKTIQKVLTKQYTQQINPNEKILIAVDDHASKGFNGLIANDLAQKYQRPAMVLRRINGILTGSFRTYGNFQMKSFLNKFPNIEYALGHEEAGGVKLKELHLDILKEFIEKRVKSNSFVSKLEYDLELDAADINTRLIKQVQKFDYLVGKGMPQAKFLIKNLFVEERKVIGKNMDTVKFSCGDVECIKFKTTSEYALEIDTFDQIDVIGTLSLNQWFTRGVGAVITCQVIIEDYKKH